MVLWACYTKFMYKVTWHDSRDNSYHTETFANGAAWGNKVLIINMSDYLRLVATEMPPE